jgi:rare lipoprotein A (peptidoglycan hydrolase)
LRARLFVAAALVVALATMSTASLSTASVPDLPGPLDAAAFEVIAGSDFAKTARTVPDPMGPRAAPVIVDFADPIRAAVPRPAPRLTVAPRVASAATPRPRAEAAPTQAAPAGSARASGNASWYCKSGVSICHNAYPGGLYAAAGPKLRVGKWRGRVVQVCGNGSCVSVKLIDWCACPGTRVIDLYSDAFRVLAPLSKGTVKVTVTW